MQMKWRMEWAFSWEEREREREKDRTKKKRRKRQILRKTPKERTRGELEHTTREQETGPPKLEKSMGPQLPCTVSVRSSPLFLSLFRLLRWTTTERRFIFGALGRSSGLEWMGSIWSAFVVHTHRASCFYCFAFLSVCSLYLSLSTCSSRFHQQFPGLESEQEKMCFSRGCNLRSC